MGLDPVRYLMRIVYSGGVWLKVTFVRAYSGVSVAEESVVGGQTAYNRLSGTVGNLRKRAGAGACFRRRQGVRVFGVYEGLKLSYERKWGNGERIDERKRTEIF